MNRINKWLAKKYGVHFIIPNRYDTINLFTGFVIGVITYWIIDISR